jgi:hypothetical protein
VSKMMVSYLESFFGVSPFLQTQDPRADARIDILYRDSMDKLDEVDYEACIKYVARKMLYQVSTVDVEASAPPPCTPNRPAAAADGPRPKRGMALSYDESAADTQLLNRWALQAG